MQFLGSTLLGLYLPLAAADPPDPRADGEYHFHLGMNHYTGLGGKPNYAEAARQFQLAASSGHARAQGQLGICLLKGRGVAQNHDLAVTWLTRAAAQKDPIALYTLGNFHARAKDHVKANQHYLDAAAQGHAAAMNNLGAAHEHGQGLPRNPAKAAQWYRNASRMNLAAAQCNLALLHASGRGADKDSKRAVELFRAAAAQGDVRAQFLLGAALHLGTLTKMDRVESAKWLQLAANQGHAAARAHLAAIQGGLSVEEKKSVDKQVATFVAGTARPAHGAVGTGFFITRQGHFITAHNLVAGANSVEVRVRDQRHLARLVKADPTHNLALMKIDAETPAISLAVRRQPHLGLPVFSIGLPPRSDTNAGPKYTHGAVRNLKGHGNDPGQLLANVEAPPAFSGAPLFDSTGQAIGMLTFSLKELRAYQSTGTLPHSLNSALKVDRIHAFLNEFANIRAEMPGPLPPKAAFAAAEGGTVLILVQ